MMKKRLFACVLAAVLLLGACASAEEAQSRAEHLKEHGKRAVFSCSGRLVKLRVAPGANKMHGCTAEGEEFILLDTFGDWVRVEITKSNPDNAQSRRGMTGWIHVDHVACACDLMQEEPAQ